MKAFLLAGGLGTRLLPLTEKIPKCLLPIKGTPMLQIWFELFRRYEITEILINVHRHADSVRHFIERRSEDLKVRVFEETDLLGSAGTVLANRDWVSTESTFWIIYADVLTTADLTEMLNFHNDRGQIATIGVCEVPNPTLCGIVQVDDEGVVRQFVEKPRQPLGNLAFSGLMLGTNRLLDVISNSKPIDFGFHVLPKIVGRTAAYRISGFLTDIGTLESYQFAQHAWPGLPESKVAGRE